MAHQTFFPPVASFFSHTRARRSRLIGGNSRKTAQDFFAAKYIRRAKRILCFFEKIIDFQIERRTAIRLNAFKSARK
jgi:hypothetical protein